jgi:hypothetical protein
MSSFNAGNAAGVGGSSGISTTMASGYDVMLYVGQLQQVVGTGLTLNMYAYDLNTVTGLPSDIRICRGMRKQLAEN